MHQRVGLEVDERVDVVGRSQAQRVGQAADLTDVAAHFVGIAHPDAHQFEERVLHDFRDHHLADKTGSPHHNSLGHPLPFT